MTPTTADRLAIRSNRETIGVCSWFMSGRSSGARIVLSVEANRGRQGITIEQPRIHIAHVGSHTLPRKLAHHPSPTAGTHRPAFLRTQLDTRFQGAGDRSGLSCHPPTR